MFFDNSSKMNQIPDHIYERDINMIKLDIELFKYLTLLRPPPDWNRCFLYSFFSQNKPKCEWMLVEGKVDIRLLLDTTIDYLLFGNGIRTTPQYLINRSNVICDAKYHSIFYKPLKEHDKSYFGYLFDYVTKQNISLSFLKWIVYLCIRKGAINNIPREILELIQKDETSLLFTISLIKYEFIDNAMLDMNMLMIELPKYVFDL